MKILIDTHIFIWFIDGSSKLTANLRDAIRDPANDVYLSPVSIWESIIKQQLGKLSLASTGGRVSAEAPRTPSYLVIARR